MNILHLSDLHFGPRHWEGDDEILLEKINSYPADVVIDTGDTTTDGRECEYAEARRFLDQINYSPLSITVPVRIITGWATPRGRPIRSGVRNNTIWLCKRPK